MSQENERRIALFLDFENLVTNTGISSANFDLQGPMDRLLEKGKVIFRRAYADWSRFREAKSTLHELGVELIDVPPSTRSGKNGADMRLVIDALELCYARSYIDTFVIGSGDSDFCPLAYKLRENDRLVIGVGARGSTSRLFVKACDEFLYLKPTAPREPSERPEAERRVAATAASAAAHVAPAPLVSAPAAGGEPEARVEAPRAEATRGRPDRRTSRRQAEPQRNKVVPSVAREVVQRLLASATGPLNPSLIKQTIVRRQPDFDERDHGFSTFTKLLEALEGEGVCRREQRGSQWYVTPPDVSAAPSVAKAPTAAGEALAEIETKVPASEGEVSTAPQPEAGHAAEAAEAAEQREAAPERPPEQEAAAEASATEDVPEATAEGAEPAPAAEEEPSPAKGRKKRPAKKAPAQSKVPAVAREVVAHLLSTGASPLSPSSIKASIARKEPGFDERKHGFASFAKLLEALEREGVCRRVQKGRQWQVLPPEKSEPLPGESGGDEAPPEPDPDFDPKDVPF